MIKNNLITKIQHAWVLISILNEIQKIFPEKEKYLLPFTSTLRVLVNSNKGI